jgi:hypothetical protein
MTGWIHEHTCGWYGQYAVKGEGYCCKGRRGKAGAIITAATARKMEQVSVCLKKVTNQGWEGCNDNAC